MATQDRSPSLIIGQQWSTWTELMSPVEENDEEEKEKEDDKNSSDSMKLGKQDMGLFGFCPSRDEFSLVVCEKCNLLVKPQALKQHIESRHGPTNIRSLGNIPASALNSELGKKLLMPLPCKPMTPSPQTVPSGKQASGTFKPASSGKPPTKESLKQVPVSARNNPAPRLGVSMTINPVKSVKSGHRILPSTGAKSTASSTSPAFSNPVVKVHKLDKLPETTPGGTTQLPGKSEKLEENLSLPPDISKSVIRKEPSSKISTLMNGSIKAPSAISLSTPSSETATTSSPSLVSTATTLVAVTKTSADIPVSTPRSVTTFVTSNSLTKPLVIAPVMTISSHVSVAPRPVATKGTKIPKEQRERKFLPCKDREYDANKHCGVRCPETGKPCTRSLTCKTHALSLRRAVPGRKKSFDDLLKEHKAAKDALIKAKLESQNAVTSVVSTSNRVLVTSSQLGATMNALKQQQQQLSQATIAVSQRDIKLGAPSTLSSGQRLLVPSCGVPTTTTFVKPRVNTNVFQRFTASANLPAAITVKEETSASERTPDVSTKPSISSTEDVAKSESQESKIYQGFLSQHPRPMAMCQFGGRMNEKGCFLFSRKTDYVRAAFLSALDRQLNPPPHKKLCVESNLPKDPQVADSSQDPYDFNGLEGGVALAAAASTTTITTINPNNSALAASLVSISSKPTLKPKSKVPGSPIASSSSSLSSSPVASISSFTLQPSLSGPGSFSTPSSGLALNWSVKPRDGSAVSRSPSASPSPAQHHGNTPGKRKRSGSSGSAANNLIGGTSASPVLGATSVASSAALNSVNQQTGLTGIITSAALNSHQAGNLIAIPSVNLTNATGAQLGQINASSLGAAAKLNTGTGSSGGSGGTVHKNNNIFKDFSLVLTTTGIDSLNGQVVNISPAQLAELAASQGQTLFVNSFGGTAGVTSSPISTTASISVSGSPAGTSNPRPAKRSRTSSSKSGSHHHHHQNLSNPGTPKLSANALEGFKLIPSSNVISQGTLPPNAVFLDSSSLQGAVLSSVALASGGTTPTLVAITSSTANTNSVSASGNPPQLLCASDSAQLLTSSALVNGAQSGYDKSGVSRHHSSPGTKAHGKGQQQGIALGNVIQASTALTAVPIPTGSATQLCSNQAIFKPGGTFNLTKNVGKLTVQPVPLTFPISVNQQGLAALAAGKSQQQQQQQQQPQQHTLLVATSGIDPTTSVQLAGKTELHLQPQISSSSTGNVIS